MLRIARLLAVLLASAVALTAVKLWRATGHIERLTGASAEGATPSQSAPDTEARRWPPLFGAAVTAPTPVDAAPIPPLRYSLRGLAVVGPARWAVLRLDGVDLVTREGDVLAHGARVVRIHSAGVDILRDGRTTTLIFEEEGPSDQLRPDPAPDIATAVAIVSGLQQEVGRRGITDAEIGRILAEAEAGRRLISR